MFSRTFLQRSGQEGLGNPMSVETATTIRTSRSIMPLRQPLSSRGRSNARPALCFLRKVLGLSGRKERSAFCVMYLGEGGWG